MLPYCCGCHVATVVESVQVVMVTVTVTVNPSAAIPHYVRVIREQTSMPHSY
jgi:hypothetical protein